MSNQPTDEDDTDELTDEELHRRHIEELRRRVADSPELLGLVDAIEELRRPKRELLKELRGGAPDELSPERVRRWAAVLRENRLYLAEADWDDVGAQLADQLDACAEEIGRLALVALRAHDRLRVGDEPAEVADEIDHELAHEA